MQVWTKCTADVLYYDAESATTNDGGYIVRLSDEIIEVSYDDDEGAVCYRGKNNDNGHFRVESAKPYDSRLTHEFF